MDYSPIVDNSKGDNCNYGYKRNVQENSSEHHKKFKRANEDSRLQYSEEDSLRTEGDISVSQPAIHSFNSDTNQEEQEIGGYMGGAREYTDKEEGGARSNVGGVCNDEGSDKDPPLPKELLEQFEPLHCKLCKIQVPSNLMATNHYKSRKHDKRMRKFLLDDAAKRGVAPHPYAQRPREENRVAPPVESNMKCSICAVICTGQDQFTMHLNGNKHRKKLKSIGICPEDIGLISEADVNPGPGQFTTSEFSRYKTPSGQFYCKKCNVTLNSDQQLTQHLNSKNHAKKV